MPGSSWATTRRRSSHSGGKSAVSNQVWTSPAELIVQLGLVTEDLNRRWYERQSGQEITSVQQRVVHRSIPFMAATLDGLIKPLGAVFEAKFMLPWSFSVEGAIEKHMAQLQHNMLVAGSRTAVLSIINGGGKWVEATVDADPVYQTVLIAARSAFWQAVRNGHPARPVRPRAAKTPRGGCPHRRHVDLQFMGRVRKPLP